MKKKASLIIHILRDTRMHIWERCSFTDPSAAEVCTFVDSRIKIKEIHGKVSFIASNYE